MHFEKSLKRTIYPPWRDNYIDYPKLKSLLRDEGSDAGSVTGASDDSTGWTDEDETRFVEELVNVQLEKVHEFQTATIQQLRDRTASCEAKLDEFVTDKDDQEALSESSEKKERMEKAFKEVGTELDDITKEMNELEKYSRINYTGFLKATKKHDRKRGDSYRVRPLMQVRLAALPFNKEDYSPLLFRLSTMYAFIRQRTEGKANSVSMSESHIETQEEFTSHKFWVHPENLFELKTMILRRLPVLVYKPQTSREADAIVSDPTITSIYFDNPKFSLYNDKVDHSTPASSFRLRWSGQLSNDPEIFCEKKDILQDDTSTESRFTATKPKYVGRFLKEDYHMDKDVQRTRQRYGDDSPQVKNLTKNVEDIHSFIQENSLQPVLRANYTRSAFRMPGDSRVRITLDTDLALIREDALDSNRPCRDPEDWHRRDIDRPELEYPFTSVRKGEINRFPYAILEIRIRGDKRYEWASEIMSSHLVHPAPRFSKFVHGVAQLFDDYVNSFPFWLSDLDTDIRRDPHQAFEDEQERAAIFAEDQFAVGSLLKSSGLTPRIRGGSAAVPATLSPVGSPAKSLSASHRSRQGVEKPPRATADMTRTTRNVSGTSALASGIEVDAESDAEDDTSVTDSRGLRSFLPSMSKFAVAQRERLLRRSRHGQSKLPPGVTEPTFWIKNEGPIKVEAKVWLANQRTFIKWSHISILLAGLSLGLVNAAGGGSGTTRLGSGENVVGQVLGVAYTIVAVFAGLWGYGIYMHRSRLIRERSGRDFDNVFGPTVVCLGLIVALVANFAFKIRDVRAQREEQHSGNGTEDVIADLGNGTWNAVKGLVEDL